MTGTVPQREKAGAYSRMHITHRILAMLYRQSPAAMTVEAVSEVAACSRGEARVVLDMLLQTNLIEQQRSSAGVATYSASQS